MSNHEKELPAQNARRRGGPAHALDTLVQDVRFGARTIYRYPGFAASIVLTLALGIGANTAIFSLMDAVLLRLLPVSSPEELYAFGSRLGAGTMQVDRPEERDTVFFSYPDYEAIRDHNEVFSGLTAMSSFPVNAYVSSELSPGEEGIEQAEAFLVTGNFFSVLGVPAVEGRTFTAEEDRSPGAHPVAVISYAFWSRKFGRNLAVIGSVLRMNGTDYTVVGVTPPEFLGTWVGFSTDVWVPMMMQAELMRETSRDWEDSRLSESSVLWLRVVGRMKPGVTEAQAGERVTDLFRQVLRDEAGSAIAPEVEAQIAQKTIELAPFGKGFSFLRARYERPLILLAVVVGLVLVIACANVGNLFMARAAERHREVALRLAVGSSRTRMLRQLLTESLMLSLLGGAVGLILASWAIDLLLVLISSRGTAVPIEASLNGSVLLFTLGVACVSAVLFGLAPAFHMARVDLNASLKNQGAVADPKQQSWNLRRILVVSQVAVSLVLLIGAGLFLRSLETLRNVDVGFPADEVLQVEIDPQGAGYREEQLPGLYRELVDRIAAIPEVRSASMSLFPLFSGRQWRSEIVVDGFEAQSDSDTSIQGSMVTPGYFETVGIPFLAGLTFDWSDGEGASPVAIVNETMARHFFPKESPIGRTFRLDDDASTPSITIVGLVKDIVYEDFWDETPRLVYFPVLQNMYAVTSIEVRAAGDPAAVAPQVRQAIRDVSTTLPILDVMTAGEQADRSLRQENLLSKLTGFFGLLALLLAAIGLYGVMAHGVVQRTNEIGIRMALGAARSHVLWMVVKDAMWMLLLGVAIGVGVSLAGSRLVVSLLYELSGTDPVTILGAIGFLAVIAVLAGYLPARRASHMDPLRALRYE